MDKKEKYINFIVDDMIKKTDIDYDREKIKYPFSPISSFSSLNPTLLLSLPFSLILNPHLTFFNAFLSSPSFSISKYVIERYGIHDNDVDIIWKLYKGKIKELIDNG